MVGRIVLLFEVKYTFFPHCSERFFGRSEQNKDFSPSFLSISFHISEMGFWQLASMWNLLFRNMYTAKSGLAHLYLPENESPRSFPLRKKSLTNKKWGIIEICQKKNRVQKNHKGRNRRSQELASRRAGQQKNFFNPMKFCQSPKKPFRKI